MPENGRCCASGCGRPEVALLDAQPFCREHFFTVCYERLEACGQQLREGHARGATNESVRRFLTECTRLAASLAQTAPDLSNLQRAQLLDILLWAGELGRQLRRSERKTASIPVRLRSENPGRVWEEETRTQVISLHGAMLECQHRVDTGDTLQVIRLDTVREAPARVVWHRRKGAGRFEVGLAFPDSEDFWEFS